MKKYIFIISTLLVFAVGNSCRESDLELFPTNQDEIVSIKTEKQLQMLLNGGYLQITSTSLFGTKAMLFGDLMSDNLFVSNANPSFLNTYNFNFNANQQPEFGGFYSGLYDIIMNCNLVINNTVVPINPNVTRIKGEAKTLRAFAYFTLLNYYSASPASATNQEVGVPLVLENYDVNIKPARVTIAKVYDQIIKDLNEALTETDAITKKKIYLGQNAAKLILSRVYLTRRAPGDAQKVLQLSDQLIASANALYIAPDIDPDKPKPLNPFVVNGTPIIGADYNYYFSGSNDAIAENHPETIWELELTKDNDPVTGIGANIAIPAYYNRTDSKKSLLFNAAFYTSFAPADVRRGSGGGGLLTSIGVPILDDPKGYWTNKYPKFTQEGNYFRNIKIFRFSEAYLNRFEALLLSGQNATALAELNRFALSRKGNVYTGTDLLKNIMTERGKEFYAEGQRFLDLKRNNLPILRPSNCGTICTIPAGDKRFVIPVSQEALNANANLKQYPGY
jgi:hypothetical protein